MQAFQKNTEPLDFFAGLILSQSNREFQQQLQNISSDTLLVLWGIAWSIKNGAALEHLDSLNPYLAAICRIKLLAHRFAIEGTGQYKSCSFHLTALNDKPALRALYSSLKIHLNVPERAEILDVFKRNLTARKELNPKMKAEEIYDQYKKGQTVLIPLLYDLTLGLAHYYGILLKGNYLIKLNQGIKETLPSGLHIYQISDANRVTPAFIEMLLTKNIVLSYFEKGMDKELGLLSVRSIITRSLTAGICAWSLAKLAFRGTLILEKQESSTYQENVIFKSWKRLDSAQEAESCIDQDLVNQRLAASLWCKTKNPALQEKLETRLISYDIADPTSTPLHLAAKSNNWEVVRKLIGKGFSVNCTDSEGKTPLVEAALQGHPDLVQLLLNAKAEINQLDNKGISAFCHVKIKQHLSSKNTKLKEKLIKVEQILITNGANKNLSKFFKFLGEW